MQPNLAPALSSPPVTDSRVLIVDDEPILRRTFARVLAAAGHSVDAAADGAAALELFDRVRYDVVVTDLWMPNMDGLDLVRRIRARDRLMPVVLLTGSPSLETAVHAVEVGALRYLTKPVGTDEFCAVIASAVAERRATRAPTPTLTPPLAIEFDRALETLVLAFQPIVRWATRSLLAYEALARPSTPTLSNPGALFSAAEQLGRTCELGRHIRRLAATAFDRLTTDLFVNLHAAELLDDDLYDATTPLAQHSRRVVLEITERAAVDEIKDLEARIAALRALGYRIAIDDLGAGYAGLTTVAQLRPDVVKLDMSLVRGIHQDPTRQLVVKSLMGLFHEMKRPVVVEGVECAEERDALLQVGCDLFQGYFFGRPGPAFPPAVWR